MACWMRLSEALQRKEEFPDIPRRPVLYSPGLNKISLGTRESGWHMEQTMSAENDHTYMAVLYNGEVYLVSRSTDKSGIILCGLDGYKNAIVILRNYARTYSNDAFGGKGVILDEETIGILDQLPEEYRTIEKKVYWTAIKECEVEKDPFSVKRGFYCMTPQGKKHETLYEQGGRYGKEAKAVCACLRPVIRLSPNIRVNMQRLNESSLDEPLEIKLV